jgi:hypothetical protein
MPTPTASANFIKAVRTFSVQTPSWGTALRYSTLPDERYDITLVAERAYGDRAEFLAIFAAAGMDTMEQLLPEQLLILPTYAQLQTIKRQTGFLTDAEQRSYDARS